MKRRALPVIGMVIVLSVLPAQSLADTFRFRAAGSESEGWRWRPGTRHINKGDRVVWKNPTDKRHTVTAYGRKWRKDTGLSPGERTAKKFRRKGRFKFRCTVRGHSALNDGRCVGMCGKVVVH